jgi:phosphonate transport system substrate-binding protein
MIGRPLRFATFLAPNLLPLYSFLARYTSERLGLPTELGVGTAYEGLAGQAEVSFICGLAYVELKDQGEPVEALAAPVLRGPRYGGRPVYFSDVIVRQDSTFTSFADLRGASWSYNEPRSHSGYGITRYHLVQQGETAGFFGCVVQTGWHERSIRLVCSGAVDASAIDSQVLAVALRDRPGLASRLRIIASLGPSTIQPVVVASWLPATLKADLQALLGALGTDSAARPYLDHGLVEGFVPLGDSAYDDIRRMRACCLEAGFATLR